MQSFLWDFWYLCWDQLHLSQIWGPPYLTDADIMGFPFDFLQRVDAKLALVNHVLTLGL